TMREAELGMIKREGRGWAMETWVGAIRMAFKGLQRNPTFALAVELLLATGIAATTTVFAVVDAVVIRALPYPEPEELIYLDNGAHARVDFVIWESEISSIRIWGGVWNREADLTGEGPPDRVELGRVTEDYFDLLGARVVQGRLFQPDEFGPDAEVVVVSHGYWQSRWGSDPGLIGRQIRIGGSPMTVVGVLSPDFRPFRPTDLWTPIDIDFLAARGHGTLVLSVVGRLSDGVGVEAAREEMEAMSESLQERFPGSLHDQEDGSARQTPVVPLKEVVVGTAGRTGWILLAAVGFLMLIACANVANLFLARGAQRTREMALRGALGAGRLNMIAQLGSESLLLSVAGGALGVTLALGGVHLFGVLEPGMLPRADSVEVSTRVMFFAVALSLATGLVFGILPAVRATRIDPSGVLKADSGQSTQSRPQRRLRTALVVSEVALSMVLLAGAGILFHSFVTLIRVDTGIQSSNLVTVHLQLLPPYTEDERAQFLDGVMARLRSTVPEVRAIVAAPQLPFQNPNGGFCCSAGTFERNGVRSGFTFRQPVTPGYFSGLGIRLTEGVEFQLGDEELRPLPIVIDEAISQQLFSGESPLGQSLGIFRGAPMTVVGVAPSVKHSAPDQDPIPTVYMPWRFLGVETDNLTLGIRTAASLEVVAPIVREAIWAQDPNLPIPEIATMEIRLDRSVAGDRFLAALFAAFAVIAGLMAAGGLYGTLLYTVRQRHREMGIRIAVGAQVRDLVTMVLKEGTTMILLGIGLGLAGVWAGGRVLESYVFGISPRDPLTIATVAGLLATVALLACLVPALKAASTDPLEALRAE
ncbi:MAG: ABC transporter permease, partial [Planctomycetota bacterium]|nr:ABC transporter permease [Planctomycetota bacterium]